MARGKYYTQEEDERLLKLYNRAFSMIPKEPRAKNTAQNTRGFFPL